MPVWSCPRVPDFEPSDFERVRKILKRLPTVPTHVPKVLKPKGNAGEGDGPSPPPIAPTVIPSMEVFEDFNEAIVDEQVIVDEVEHPLPDYDPLYPDISDINRGIA